MTDIVHGGQFTRRKVPVTAASLIDAFTDGASLRLVSVDRFSLNGSKGAEGILGQARLTGDLFHDHPPTRTYASLPASLFEDARDDPSRLAREAGALGYRAQWVRRSDLWPTERSNAIVAALIIIEDTLFVRVESSGAKREIANFAGTDWNAYALLVFSLAQHLDGPTMTRWSDDVERTGRDVFSVDQIFEAHKERGKRMQFGSRVADPQDPNDRTLLALLSTLGAAENERRAVKMAGHTIAQLERGGAPLSEDQLPHGIFHLRRTTQFGLAERDEVVRFEGMLQPTFDPRYRLVIEQAVRRHADGASYVDIGLFLAEQGVERRGQKKLAHRTFADVAAAKELNKAARRVRLAESAKSFFTVATHEDGDWISDPEHPNQDRDRSRLYTAKLELWQTGIYPTKLEVRQLTGRGRTVKGRHLNYDHDDATTGWLSAEARWFVDDDGACTLPIDLPDDVWQKSRQRLLRERGRRRSGGAAHIRDRQRVFAFDGWFEPHVDLQQPSTWPAASQFTLTARDTHGRKNFVLRQRPASGAITTSPGRAARVRGWVNGEGVEVATINSAELATWLGHAAAQATVEVLDDLVALDTAPEPARLPADHDERARANADRVRLDRELTEAQDELTGARRARNRAEGRLERAKDDSAKRHATDALESAASDVRVAEQEVQRIRRELSALDSDVASGVAPATEVEDEPVAVDVADLAWWIAGLLRSHDGLTTPRHAEVTQQQTSDWRFSPDPVQGGVVVTCRLEWPLADGRTFSRKLTGLIDDLRTSAAGAAGAAAWAVGVQGQALDDYVRSTPRSSRRQTVDNLLAWLRDRGIVRDTARQTIVDHPFPHARRVVFGACAGSAPTVPTGLTTWRDHLVKTYQDPRCPASRSAAIRHDLKKAHALMAGLERLGQSGQAVTSRKAALREAGFTSADLQRLLSTFVWLEDDGDTLRAQACPHEDCDTRWATVLVPLPEVLVTGYAVICPECRRVPDLAWSDLQFPAEYADKRLTRATGDTSLFVQGQTDVLDGVEPAKLTHAPTGTTTQEVAAQLGRSTSWVLGVAASKNMEPIRHAKNGAAIWAEHDIRTLQEAR